MLIGTWIVTFVLIIGVGIYAGTKITQANQWSGGDRSMSVFAVGAMLGAWQIGGMSVVGAAQNGYTMGIAGCWYSIASGLYILLIGLLAGPLRRNLPSDALPDYLEGRYSTTVARVQSYVWIVFGILYIPIQLKTIASIIQIVLPQLNTGLAMFVGVTIAAVYTGFAGMKGSAAIGRVVCVATYVLLIWFVVSHLGEFGGYSGLIQRLPEGYDKLSAMPAQEIIAWALGGALSSVVLQSALQPMLAAKDDRTARNGCILGYVIAAPICILTAMIGMMARASNDGLGDGATAFAWAIRDMSSPVMAGIIFAVCTMIIAATMATMMMATGTILTNIYKKQINPDASDRKVLQISRFGTIIVAYISLLVGFFIPSAQMTSLFLTLTYVVTSPFSYSVIVGLFWKRVNARASLVSVGAGIITAILWVASGMNDTLNVVYPTILVSYAAGIAATLLNQEHKS
ncbi:UNVERIFIED_ORG: sodium:proline symporter [Lacrimispora saccharolytica]|nr:sodium:solute symporter family protein [Clostridium sp.]HJG83543.1 sodium:solute symporter family protein [Lacrimispora saccharolytica]